MKNFITLLLFSIASISGFSQALSGFKFCIDPGHGGHTSDDREINLPNGIVYWESEGDLETALHLQKYLKDLGANVMLTRTENSDASDIGLSARSTIANNFGADFFQSIHTNAYNQSSNYTLVLYKETDGTPAFQQAKNMGDILAPNIKSVLYTNTSYNRGDFSFLGFHLGVLNYASMPSLLSEGAFHDVPAEGLRLKNHEYLKNYAWAIAKTLCAYYQTGGFTVGRIGGIVNDIKTGNPINGITVNASPGTKSYTGDDLFNGFYALDSLVPGTYDLTFSKDGYISKTIQVVIEANTYTKLDINLQYFNNGYPNVIFSISNTLAEPGTNIKFNATDSYDDGQIVSYDWDFGDGTSGSGVQDSHIYQADGTYNVKLKITDNDGKISEATKSIEIKTTFPESPQILYVVKNNTGGIKIKWTESASPVITGYRIYASNADDLSAFEVLASENDISSGTSEFVVNPTVNSLAYTFKLSAVNSAGESIFSDTYSYFDSNQPEAKSVLIVDGFDRKASYSKENHSFSSVYMQTVRDAGNVKISSCANEAITGNLVNLNDYKVVIWFLGDESTKDETFSGSEQVKLKEYLEQGGYMFTCGSEIGWDLASEGSNEDKNFYHDYLKSQFIDDGAPTGRTPATGLAGTLFNGITLNFGVVYPEDYPDGISAYGGSINILKYANNTASGIAYKGSFGISGSIGAVVYLGFPLETVADKTAITQFMQKLLAFFNGEITALPGIKNTSDIQVFPTLFNDQITITSNKNNINKLNIKLLDMNGKCVYENSEFINQDKNKYEIKTSELNSGSYILKISSTQYNQSFKVIKK